MKYRPSCGEPKSDEPKSDAEFSRNRSLPDGSSFYCLRCDREGNDRWYRDSRRAIGREVRDHSWVPDGSRWCPTCRQAVAHHDFARSNRTSSGFASQGKACKALADSEAYSVRRYGMTREGVEDIGAGQGDRCALCGEIGPEHLGHDHENDFVRALLCQRCTVALGLVRDDPPLMRAAADYVGIHRARDAKAVAQDTSGAVPGEPSDRGARR